MSALYVSPFGFTVVACVGMFIATLFIISFFPSAYALLIKHDKLRYHSSTSFSPIVSLVIFPLIAVAIVAGEFWLADYLGLSHSYVLLAMLISIVLVFIARKLFSRSGISRLTLTSLVDENVKKDGDCLSTYVYNYCGNKVDEMRSKGVPDVHGLSDDEIDILIDGYSKSRIKYDRSALILNYLDHEVRSYDEAFEEALRRSEAGDVDYMYLVALMYGVGMGTWADSVKSLRFMEKAAEAGHKEAANTILHCRMWYPDETKDALGH